MIKTLLLTPLLLTVLLCNGQNSVDGMIQAEKEFSNMALSSGTKKSFVSFADSMGVVFDKGNPTNAISFYNKKEKESGILQWQPEYAEISSSNDFGFTTGPWSFYNNSLKEKPAANGHFITVWHLAKTGWKFLIDLGISYPDQIKPKPLKKMYTQKNKMTDDEQSMNRAEEKFIEAYKKSASKAYSQFLSANSRLNYSNHAPATDAAARTALLASLPKNIEYNIIGSGVSVNDDLGYMYGTATINGKKEGYLRIWRKEKTGWKIALEVLHF